MIKSVHQVHKMKQRIVQYILIKLFVILVCLI